MRPMKQEFVLYLHKLTETGNSAFHSSSSIKMLLEIINHLATGFLDLRKK